MSADTPGSSGLTSGRALGLWLALFAVFCFPFLRGEVIFPHDNARELGLASAEDGGESVVSNRFFSDYSSVYVPELAMHMNGERNGWIATWNPHVELGRPAGQLAGLGKGYWPTHIATFLFDDPVRALTWLTVLALLLAGLFAFGLLREMELSPLAAWTGAVGASLGIYPLFWLTFAVHLWSVTWTLGLLWGIARFVRRPGFVHGVLVAFLLHSMLLSAYPQAIVWSIYLIVPFAWVRLRRVRPGKWREPLFGLAVAAILGAFSAMPVWMDVVIESGRSARGDINASYFLPSLPRLRGVAAAFDPLGQLVDPFRFGNPVDPAYGAASYKGTSLAPAFAALIVVALASFRRAWGLWVMVFVALAMTLRPLVYLFAVERLGLGLSRFPPLAGAFVPLLLLVAFGVDRVSSTDLKRRGLWALFACVPYAVALGAALVPWTKLGQGYDPPALATTFVVVGIVATLGSAAFVATRRSWLWIGIVAVTTLVYGRQLALVRPSSSVQVTSPAIGALRGMTKDGTRFMKVGARVRILPPNQEAWLGVHSVHTYNSLVSREYRRWVTKLHPDGMDLGHDGEWADYVEEGDYGRQFRRARASSLTAAEMSWTGTSVLLSKTPLDAEVFEPLGGDLYRPRFGPVREAQFVTDDLVAPIDPSNPRHNIQVDERLLLDGAYQPVERVIDRGDLLRFHTTPSEDWTVLFVSQQYHPGWEARTQDTYARVFPLRDLYTGVYLPPGTELVELRFRAVSILSWWPQVGFLLLGVGILLTKLTRRSA